MQKTLRIFSLTLLTVFLSFILVGCGVPSSLGDARDKLEAAGYEVDYNTSVSASGTYVALKAYQGNLALTVVYFPKPASTASEYFTKITGQYHEYDDRDVKMKTVGNFVVVYHGYKSAMRDFEK